MLQNHVPIPCWPPPCNPRPGVHDFGLIPPGSLPLYRVVSADPVNKCTGPAVPISYRCGPARRILLHYAYAAGSGSSKLITALSIVQGREGELRGAARGDGSSSMSSGAAVARIGGRDLECSAHMGAFTDSWQTMPDWRSLIARLSTRYQSLQQMLLHVRINPMPPSGNAQNVPYVKRQVAAWKKTTAYNKPTSTHYTNCATKNTLQLPLS